MKSLFYLNAYFWKYRYRLLLGTIFIIFSNLFAIYPAQVIRHALDLLAENLKYYHLLGGSQVQSIFAQDIFVSAAWFALLILLLAVIKGAFVFMNRQTIIIMSRLIERDLKNEIFTHYQRLDLAFYKRNTTGDMMARISEDVSRVRMYIGPAIMYSLNLVVLFVLVVGTMIHVNSSLTLYVLLPMPILGLTIFLVSSKIERGSDLVQSKLSDLSTYVQEAFSGIRILKGFVREPFVSKEFEVQSEAYKNRALELAKTNALFFPIMLILVGLSTLLTIYIGGMEVIAGRATFGTIAEFIYYVNMLTWPFAQVGWVTSMVQRAAASQKRINEFLHTLPTIRSATNETFEMAGEVEFKHVDFKYPDTGIHALKNISFRIPAGKTIAIVGHTGSGKSSIASLLLRLYDPQSGLVCIDGKDIREISLGSMREQMGYVPQEVFLFSDSIENNISFGDSSETRDSNQIVQVAKDVAVYDNVMEFPESFKTIIGERGVTLSGGQKQRLSIARALLRKPKILIFDDCLSAVDTHTEEEILKNLKSLSQGITTILISHRISTVKYADFILVLEQGKIVEQGTHQVLVCSGKYYQRMYDLQQLENEIG